MIRELSYFDQTMDASKKEDDFEKLGNIFNLFETTNNLNVK